MLDRIDHTTHRRRIFQRSLAANLAQTQTSQRLRLTLGTAGGAADLTNRQRLAFCGFFLGHGLSLLCLLSGRGFRDGIFAPSEDFSSYPRTWKSDTAKLAAEKVDAIWNPDVKTMYPDGFATRIVPEGPATVGLEDRFRPHFFAGVATVVGKLFTQVRPDVAIFGEKDFQQLRVVTRMAADLDLGVKVIGSRTVRERDGLAMSSRNVYLAPEERRAAPVLYRAMKQAAGRLRAGDEVAAAIAAGVRAVLRHDNERHG